MFVKGGGGGAVLGMGLRRVWVGHGGRAEYHL